MSRIDVFLIDLRASDAELTRLTELLDANEIAQSRKFTLAEHARRFCVRRGLRREILATRLGSDPRDIRYEFGARDKPRVAGSSPVHFNASHSADRALLAVTEVGPLGVDIEALKAIPERDGVVSRFFSAAEQTAYRQVPQRDRQRAFYYGWTRKEAFIKATGKGLGADLSAFDVALTPGEPAQLLRAEDAPDEGRCWHLVDLDVGRGYIGALAVQCPIGTGIDVRIERVTPRTVPG